MHRYLKIAIIACVALTLACLPAFCTPDPLHTIWDNLGLLLGCAALGTVGFNRQDANLSLTLTLPNAASTTANSGNSIDTEASSNSDFLANCEAYISAPALNTTVLPDTKTMTYALLASNNSNMAGAVVVINSAIVQTGASGAGAAAATVRIRLPTDIAKTYGRYLGLQAVSGANTTNAAASSATLSLLA